MPSITSQAQVHSSESPERGNDLPSGGGSLAVPGLPFPTSVTSKTSASLPAPESVNDDYHFSNASYSSSKPYALSCHQCKTTKSSTAVLCCMSKAELGKRNRGCRKKYCSSCLSRAYNIHLNRMTEQEIANWICPACKDICLCAHCKRSKADADRERESASDHAPSSDDKQTQENGDQPSMTLPEAIRLIISNSNAHAHHSQSLPQSSMPNSVPYKGAHVSHSSAGSQHSRGHSSAHQRLHRSPADMPLHSHHSHSHGAETQNHQQSLQQLSDAYSNSPNGPIIVPGFKEPLSGNQLAHLLQLFQSSGSMSAINNGHSASVPGPTQNSRSNSSSSPSPPLDQFTPNQPLNQSYQYPTSTSPSALSIFSESLYAPPPGASSLSAQMALSPSHSDSAHFSRTVSAGLNDPSGVHSPSSRIPSATSPSVAHAHSNGHSHSKRSGRNAALGFSTDQSSAPAAPALMQPQSSDSFSSAPALPVDSSDLAQRVLQSLTTKIDDKEMSLDNAKALADALATAVLQDKAARAKFFGATSRTSNGSAAATQAQVQAASGSDSSTNLSPIIDVLSSVDPSQSDYFLAQQQLELEKMHALQMEALQYQQRTQKLQLMQKQDVIKKRVAEHRLARVPTDFDDAALDQNEALLADPSDVAATAFQLESRDRDFLLDDSRHRKRMKSEDPGSVKEEIRIKRESSSEASEAAMAGSGALLTPSHSPMTDLPVSSGDMLAYNSQSPTGDDTISPADAQLDQDPSPY